MPEQCSAGRPEEGVDVPYEQINAETLRRMIQEFVTRDGADWADPGCSLEDKIEQVMKQLKNQKIKVVFDLTSESANLVEMSSRKREP